MCTSDHREHYFSDSNTGAGKSYMVINRPIIKKKQKKFKLEENVVFGLPYVHSTHLSTWEFFFSKEFGEREIERE